MTTLPRCHVVSHVHWDREWYRPFEEFRGRLLELVTRVLDGLDDGSYPYFHLDGQTIVVRDVLDIDPSLAARLAIHARSGRLTVGPWHVLADNQLVSAESLVRNLLKGRRWTEQLGAHPSVGYSPDSFGHPADLPRVLTGFGMTTALVWRGAPPEYPYFTWTAPDGSAVTAVNQAYHAAEVLWPGDDLADRVNAFLSAARERSPQGPWLLMDGGDHLCPAPVPPRINAAGEVAPDVRFVPSTPAEHFSELPLGASMPTVDGPLRHPGARMTFLLDGTLSTRAALKRANAQVFCSLERNVEPLLSLLLDHESTRDTETREMIALLDHAWELALENSPHDSICGCSVDSVHRDNAVRAERVGDVVTHLRLRALQRFGIDTRRHGDPELELARVVVSNGHGHPVTEPVRMTLTTAPGRHVVAVRDENGRSIPWESTVGEDVVVFESDLDLLADNWPARTHDLAFVAADVPAFGWRSYVVELADQALDVAAHDDGRGIDTWDGCQVRVADDGSLDVETPDGKVHRAVAALHDIGDRGDTYTTDLVGPEVRGRLLSVQRSNSAARTRLVAKIELEIPTGLTMERSARSSETIPMVVRAEVNSWTGIDGLEIRFSWTNEACDHRLRASVPVSGTNWRTDMHWSVSDHAFGPEFGPRPEGHGGEARHNVMPAQSYVAVPGELAVLVAGPAEVSGVEDEQGRRVEVTLARSVGWLSRPDLTTRTASAGPTYDTADAQELGPQAASMWVLFGDGTDEWTLAVRGGQHRSPLATAQLRPGHAAAPPPAAPHVTGGVVSAWKPTDDAAPGESVLRVWNPTGHSRTLSVGWPGHEFNECRMDETLIAGRPTVWDAWIAGVEPWGTRSLRVRHTFINH